MQEIKGKTLNVKFSQDLMDELDRIAGRIGEKRTETIRKLLGLGIEVFHGYEKIGMVKIIEMKNRAKKSINSDLNPTLF